MRLRSRLTSSPGLSPRVRGNLPAALGEEGRPGSIPACAGEPGRRSSAPATWRVYPRVCGGTLPSAARDFATAGLSPRVRGNHFRDRRPRLRGGSIPACAGEPWRERPGERRAGVYPRVCGGTIAHRDVRFGVQGLSPRVRGNPACPARPPTAWGSIPACAGEPGWSGPRGTGARVYPRVCGGTGHAEVGPAHPGGSIPACAGEPASVAARRATDRVYPRVCGGTRDVSAEEHLTQGLSPRVRGNRSITHDLREISGSIPACAGEPAPAGAGASAGRVYPRVCGGTGRLEESWNSPTGLSPRVRGNRIAFAARRGPRGSIPACAGEPTTCSAPTAP